MRNGGVSGSEFRGLGKTTARPARGEGKTVGKGLVADARRNYQIEIIRRSRPGKLSDRRIRQVIEHVLRRHKVRRCELEIIVLGLTAMEKLNRRWLGHQGATDAIAFDLGDEPADRSGEVAGQINVCWPVARKQAARRSHTGETELLLYTVHGLLHLLGYDDHDPKAAVRMHGKEDELFEEIGLGRVYSAHASSSKGAK